MHERKEGGMGGATSEIHPVPARSTLKSLASARITAAGHRRAEEEAAESPGGEEEEEGAHAAIFPHPSFGPRLLPHSSPPPRGGRRSETPIALWRA